MVLIVADWPEDQTEAAQRNGETKHLWEESWDDDDTNDDFSKQLKCVTRYLGACVAPRVVLRTKLTIHREELKKVEAAKRK